MTKILFLVALAVIGIYDIKKKEIPDRFVIALAVCALADAFLFREPGWVSRCVGTVCISIPLLWIAVMTRGGFGGGDVKLTAAGGLFLGWKLMLEAAVIAFLMAGLYIVAASLRQKVEKKTQLPFGPFLCIGMAVSVLWGEEIIFWYVNSPLY